MIWCLAALAGPLPPWVEDGRFEGFVQLDSTELATGILESARYHFCQRGQ